MTITAKYASQCPQCQGRIQPGEPVEWTRGNPAYHVACAKAERAAFASLDRTRRPRTEVEEDAAETRWQEDRHLSALPMTPRGTDLRLTLKWDE